MSFKDRNFHSLLFEAIALVLLTLLPVIVTGNAIAQISGLAIALSMIATVWNFSFNILFDSCMEKIALAEA